MAIFKYVLPFYFYLSLTSIRHIPCDMIQKYSMYFLMLNASRKEFLVFCQSVLWKSIINQLYWCRVRFILALLLRFETETYHVLYQHFRKHLFQIYMYFFKGFSPLLKSCFYCFYWEAFKNDDKCFYFMLKTLFVLEIFAFQ